MIYVITTGSYSDYRIVGATTDPDRAEDMRKKVACMTIDDVDIEEYEDGKFSDYEADYDEAVPTLYWNVTMKETGEVTSCYSEYLDGIVSMSVSHRAANGDKGPKVYVDVKHIRSDDEKRAIKIAKEARDRYLTQLFGL